MPESHYPENSSGRPPRLYSAQDTSSIFSPTANPDEDWTKISNLAERRRIQNRIAQRNYRKKLKRRLEALERRSGDSKSEEKSVGSEQQETPARTLSRTFMKSCPSRSVASYSMPPSLFFETELHPLETGNGLSYLDQHLSAPHFLDSPSEGHPLSEDAELQHIQSELAIPLKTPLYAVPQDISDCVAPEVNDEWIPHLRDLHSRTLRSNEGEATDKDAVRNSQSPSSDSSNSEQTTDESDFEGLPGSHSLMLSLPAILRSSLPRFISWAHQHAGAPKTGGDGTRTQGSSDKGKATASSSKRKSNPHSSGSGDQDALDGDGLGSNKRRKAMTPNDDDDEGPTLACPFYKKDKIAHSKCLLFRLRRIKDVKQHLTRKHIQPQFCARCGRHFDTQESLRAHTRNASCVLADFMEPEGITEDQKKELGARVGRKFGLAEQWYQVWDILFPLLDRPISPFVESPIQEVLTGLREYWAENGQSIITEHIQGTEALPYSVPHEERDLASLYSTGLQQSMTLLVDRYIDTYVARATLHTDMDGSSTQNETITLPIETTRGLDELASTRDVGPPEFGTNRVESSWWTGSDIRPYDQIDLSTSREDPDTTAEASQGIGELSALDDAAIISLGSCVGPADLERFDDWMGRLNEGGHGDWHTL